MASKIIIAIDGYSSCGKSTIARGLATQLGYVYIDTGAMYRAVTLYFLDHNVSLKDDKAVRHALGNIRITFHYNEAKGNSDTYLNGIYVEDEIRGMRVSNQVSNVSALLPVRGFLVDQQKDMGQQKGIIMDGRDIGTNVFPEAELKLFVTADSQVRTKRRYDEMVSKGIETTMSAVHENLTSRDHIDSTREHSPLTKAEDAIVLDNTDLSISEQLEWVMEKVAALQALD